MYTNVFSMMDLIQFIAIPIVAYFVYRQGKKDGALHVLKSLEAQGVLKIVNGPIEEDEEDG
jgi:hypothetical protein